MSPGRSDRSARGSGGGEPELDALARLVGAHDDGWSRAREERLVRRVLSETTRRASEPAPGLRGDLTLVLEFLVARFRSSRALRVAAALSVVAHVAAVPALALWLRTDEEPVPLLRFDPPAELPFTRDVEPPRELALPEGSTEFVPPAKGEREAGARDACRLARFLLERHGVPAAGADAPAALRRRAGLPASAGLADVEPERWRAASDLEHCLWAEAALDAYVLRKELPPWWGELRPALARLAERPGPLTELARSSLHRGALYGAWDAQGSQAQAGVTQAGAPLREGWLDALQALLEASGPGASGVAGGSAIEAWLRAARALAR